MWLTNNRHIGGGMKCSSNKIQYNFLIEAMKEIKRLGKKDKKYLYAYECKECGFYHITNDSKHNGVPNIKKIAQDGRIIYARL